MLQFGLIFLQKTLTSEQKDINILCYRCRLGTIVHTFSDLIISAYTNMIMYLFHVRSWQFSSPFPESVHMVLTLAKRVYHPPKTRTYTHLKLASD